MKTGSSQHFKTHFSEFQRTFSPPPPTPHSPPSQTELIGKMMENTNNKIPEYAREYKREYQFIIGLNKEFKNLKDFIYNKDINFKSHKLDRIMNFIKRFLRAQEKGRLKDISNFEFDYFHIENIYEIKRDINYYYSIISIYYDWSRGKDDEGLVSRYEIYKNDLELFFSKLNIEIENSDSDSDSDINISFLDIVSDSDDSDSDSDSDINISFSDIVSDSDDSD